MTARDEAKQAQHTLTPVLVALIAACSCARRAPSAHAPASHASGVARSALPQLPPLRLAKHAEPPARACRAERVVSFAPVDLVASPDAKPLAAPDLLTPRASSEDLQRVDLARVAATIFAHSPPERAASQADVCMSPDRLGREFDASVKSDRVQIFDVARVSTVGAQAPLWTVLYSRNALTALLTDGTASWGVALLDRDYHQVAETFFETVRPAEMTLDGVGAFLRVEHGLVHAHVAFGCAAKNGERFDVPIQVSVTATCARASTEAYPPDGYRKVHPQTACRAQPVAPVNSARAPTYEGTQGRSAAWLAMPYVEDDAAALDVDWLRVATILSGGAEGARPETDDRSGPSTQNIAVGSVKHSTAHWSYVSGSELVLYQLLPVRDTGGREGYLTLSSRLAPADVVLKRDAEFRVSLFSPGYELEAEVTFRAPSPGTARAFQTDLEIDAGQPLAIVRYLNQAPALPSKAEPRTELATVTFRMPLALDLASSCLAGRGASNGSAGAG